MGSHPRPAALARRTRIADWGVHIAAFALCTALYAVGYDRLPAGFAATVLRLFVLQVLLYPAGYLLNDRADIESDRRKTPERAAELRRPSLWLILLLLLGGLIWAWRLCNRATLACALVTAALAFAYSVAPLRLKVRGYAGVATAALGQRLPFFLALCASHEILPTPALLLTLYLAGLGSLFILHHQFVDLEADRVTGSMTLAVRRGRLFIHRLRLAAGGALMGLVPAAWVLGERGSWAWRAPLGFTIGYTGLVGATLLLFHLRYGVRVRRLAPTVGLRRTDGTRHAVPATVRIVGAGAAGLMAGIKLAERGVRVEVHEAGESLGGMHRRIEGVHFTHVDPARLAVALDFPLQMGFRRVDVEQGYLGGHRLVPRLRTAWVCRRGSAEGTLDSLLYKALMQRGGHVCFSSRESCRIVGSPETCILAGGLDAATLRALGLPGQRILGYQAKASGPPGAFTFHYRDSRLGRDYAYAAGVDRRSYALVFSRDALPASAPRLAAEMMHRTEGVEIEEWYAFEGLVPLMPRLFHGDKILAGAMGGLIDPFYLSGLSGGLVGGCLAALAVEEPERALDEFRWFSRNWAVSAGLSRYAQRHAADRLAFLGAASLHACFAAVGTPG